MKDYAKSFYKGKAWQNCRNYYYLLQHGICQRCGSSGDIVHHKIYITPSNINDPSITLNYDNLELLCIDCHNREHFSKYNNGIKWDSNGEPIFPQKEEGRNGY